MEEARAGKSNNSKEDEHSNAKEQLPLPTLATLAARATARVHVITEKSEGIKTAATPITKTFDPMAIINQVIGVQLGAESNDKPLSQKSDDSDCTLQSDQSECSALKTLATMQLAEDGKIFAGEHTLDRILLEHSEQTITTARVELDCNTSRATRELMLQAGSGGVMKSLAAVRDATMAAKAEGGEMAASGASGSGEGPPQTTPTESVRSIGSLVCRICHNSENPERLVSPCLCKGSLTYVHIHCLERWISTSRSTVCELCQFQYNTVQTLRYTCLQSLRMWYSRSMSRRALQEDCQMFSLLTLVAFGIIGTLLVGIQYYFLQGQAWGLSRMWTKGWLVFFLFTTLTIYFINIYMILKSQLSPWYRWWQSARDIKLILENRKPFQFRPNRRLQNHQLAQELSDMAQQQQQQQNAGAATAPTCVAPRATPNPTTQQPYQPNQPIQPTTAVFSTTLHVNNVPMAHANTCHHLPIWLNSIELQCSEFNNDDDVMRCCGKRPLAKASSRGVAVAMHCPKLTTAATIEIPLVGRPYQLETVL
ncbi:uncharacterized protein LOC118751793 [Rhagoletis pomonella]|uniref:uncharacterized protein LOC118751793 n=1 Tax=Rhagoletis pomonella TaxID=28610 RepID=UPI00177B3B13|nr:uncharacterized protein LOC118751793 [Rhagoletis pomonella]